MSTSLSVSARPAVVLAKDLARSIKQGHPWIYRDALLPARGVIPAGALVNVQSRGGGLALGWGYWDPGSPIAVRILGHGPVPTTADVQTLLRERLTSALGQRLARLDPAHTNAFRWVHGEADRLPGIHLDVYDDVAAVRFDGDGARACYQNLEALLHHAAAGTRLVLRRMVDRDQRHHQNAQTNQPLSEVVVRENDHRFVVDLDRGQKGGLFLDQRENRAAVAAESAGKTVLNLFGYTGGFSVYAAAAGARRTTTVDLARPAIETARRNFELNGFPQGPTPDERHTLHAADAFEFLTAAAIRGERWDIVISDPPSFAPRADALPAARASYRRLHSLAAAVVAPGGLFCPASCSSHFPVDEFLASVTAGTALAGRRFTLRVLRGAGFDHPVIPAFPEGDYLKFAMGRMD